MSTAQSVRLRPIQLPDDLDFLHSVYASTREAELIQTDWDAAQKEAFTRMQFTAQHEYYMANYAQASFMLVEVDGAAAGRLYLDRRPGEIRIVDISLLPAFRGRGIGTQLISAVLEDARASHVDVTIHVEIFNPALHLYERLGFQKAEDKGVYLFMRYTHRKPTEIQC